MNDNEASPEPVHAGFPQSPSEFDRDPRISFSKLEEKWILETDEGTEYEYVVGLKRWVPVVGTQTMTHLLPHTIHHGGVSASPSCT